MFGKVIFNWSKVVKRQCDKVAKWQRDNVTKDKRQSDKRQVTKDQVTMLHRGKLEIRQ